MVFPPPTAPALADADGLGDAAVLAVVEGVEVAVGFEDGLVQAFRRILVPRVAEPYMINLRRPNCLAMPLPYSRLNQPTL